MWADSSRQADKSSISAPVWRISRMETLREVNAGKINDYFVEHGDIIALILLSSSDCQFSCDSMEDTLEYDEKSLKT